MNVLILTPVLNGARYLDAALHSVRAQNHKAWKLVVCDAGSTDGSQDIAGRHAAADPRITVECSPDRGMYDALRQGFDRHGGDADILSWLNSDDLYTPWALAEANAAISDGAQWVTGLPGLFDTQGRLRTVLPRGSHRRADIVAGRHHDGFLGSIQQESTFFSAELYADLCEDECETFAAQRLAGDFYLWRCFARRTSLVSVPSVLGGFRLHQANRSRLNAEAYLEEAASLGASVPPRPILRIWRKLHDLRAAGAALDLYVKAAAKLASETDETSD